MSRAAASHALPAALAVLALTAAACTSSGGSDAVDNPVVTNSPTTSSVTPSPSSSTPVTTSSTPAPSSSVSSSPHSSTPAPPASDACTATQLKAELLRGGAQLGVQYAAVLFTNVSQKTCTLQGYPYAQLVRGGKLIGKQAVHQASTTATVHLKPGASAQADISAVSSCNAVLSDHVRVSAPGSSTTVDLPDTLRNCSLSIKAVHRA